MYKTVTIIHFKNQFESITSAQKSYQAFALNHQLQSSKLLPHLIELDHEFQLKAIHLPLLPRVQISPSHNTPLLSG